MEMFWTLLHAFILLAITVSITAFSEFCESSSKLLNLKLVLGTPRNIISVRGKGDIEISKLEIGVRSEVFWTVNFVNIPPPRQKKKKPLI